MIKLLIIGNLGKDATVNNVNGKSVINFSVAHTEKYTDQSGQPKEKVTWVECAHWTDKTGVVPYLTKGTQVYVEGTPEAKGYAKQDGSIGSSLIVRVFTVQLLGSRPQEQQNGQYQQPAPQPQYQAPPAAAPQPQWDGQQWVYPQAPPPPQQAPPPNGQYAPVRQQDINTAPYAPPPAYANPPRQAGYTPPQAPQQGFAAPPPITGELPF